MNATSQSLRKWKRSACIGVCLGAFLCASAAHAEETPRSAMRKGLKAYEAGDYTNAVALLEKTLETFPDTGHYNLGNAYYRLGDYEQAAAHFNEALRSSDLSLQEQAYFNRGNALLARTTKMTGNEQIHLAVECAFQAMDMYEKALLLDPGDLTAKQNFERAQQLRLNLEFKLGTWYFDHAESLLSEYKARDARTNYQRARQQFEHILANVDPNHAESEQYLPKIDERLDMLSRAVDEARENLETALMQIDEYQYALAAERLTTVDDERRYAFDIEPELMKKYEETILKNQDVLKIIEDLSDLNIVK